MCPVCQQIQSYMIPIFSWQLLRVPPFSYKSIPVWIIKYTLIQTKGQCGWWSNKRSSHSPLGQIADLFGWQREILPSFKHMQLSAFTDCLWLPRTLDTHMRLFEPRLLTFGISKTEGSQYQRSVYNLAHEPPGKPNSDTLLFGSFLLLAYLLLSPVPLSVVSASHRCLLSTWNGVVQLEMSLQCKMHPGVQKLSAK